MCLSNQRGDLTAVVERLRLSSADLGWNAVLAPCYSLGFKASLSCLQGRWHRTCLYPMILDISGPRLAEPDYYRIV